MSTITGEIERGLPVREGDYGERVAAVEPGGVEFISLRERHGRPINLLWTWLSPNLEFATVFVGVIAITLFGLNMAEAALAIVVGTILGSITHAVLSSWGPKFGVPMMVQSRGAFGFFGNILPAGLNAITGAFGWFIVNSVSGAFALQALAALINWTVPFWLAFLVIVVAQVLIAALGHNLIHAFERYALPLLGIVFLLACFFIFTNAHANYGIAYNAKAPLASGELGGWLLAFTAAFGYAVGWNPYAADYTRYLPPDANRFLVGFWAGFGVALSCIALELAGAVLATVAGTKWGPNDIPTQQLQVAMPNWIYYLTLLSIAVGAVAANVINIYSGTMSLVAVGIREMGMTLRQRRALLAVAAGVLGYIGGIVFQASVAPGGKYEAFLLLISYWIAPWLAVVFVDYLKTRGRYDERHFFETGWNRWQGFAAMAIALVVSVYLFSNNALYLGKIPTAYPQIGDITFIVGFVLSAVLYFVFSLGRSPESAGEAAMAPEAEAVA